MIISDTYRFIFIHIPKCAGTFVRSHLNPYNEYPQFYHNQDHPIIGKIDYSHIPLSVLEKYFNEVYLKVIQYDSFSLIRDPYSRFNSSFRQHLEEYQGIHLNNLRNSDIKKKLEEVIKRLTSNLDAELLPIELIHFQKQKHYIFNNDSRIVDRVYTIHEVMRSFSDLKKMTDLPIELESIDKNKKINPSHLAFKYTLVKRISESPRPFKGNVMKYLPFGMQNAIRRIFFISTTEKSKEIFESGYIKEFIEFFYREDIDLYTEIKGNN